MAPAGKVDMQQSNRKMEITTTSATITAPPTSAKVTSIGKGHTYQAGRAEGVGGAKPGLQAWEQQWGLQSTQSALEAVLRWPRPGTQAPHGSRATPAASETVSVCLIWVT